MGNLHASNSILIFNKVPLSTYSSVSLNTNSECSMMFSLRMDFDRNIQDKSVKVLLKLLLSIKYSIY